MVSRTLSGLRSRCTIPAARAAARNLRRDVERLAQSELGPTQRLPVNEFADHVSIAVVVHRDDVGIVERRHGPVPPARSAPAAKSRQRPPEAGFSAQRRAPDRYRARCTPRPHATGTDG
jgi:hypothetical protein